VAAASTSPGLDASDSLEAQALARLPAASRVPTLVVGAGAPPEAASGDALVVVRSAAPVDPPFFCATPTQPPTDATLARELAALLAEAVLSVSPSRFASSLSRDADVAAIDEALGRLAVAALGAPLPALDARVPFLVERARAKAKAATVLVQTLEPGARYGLVVTRDLRTGLGPPRAAIGSSPRALIEPAGSTVPLGEIAALTPAERESLEQLAWAIESDLKRPARIAFQIGGAGPQVVSITPLRHSGRAAIALAAALVESGRLAPAAALDLVTPADLASALQLRLEPEPAQIVGRGVAAGGGTAVGYACFSPARAAVFAERALPPILFVEELVAEDSGALATSRAVVTVRGGITGEAAIMSRALAKPCVASGPVLSLATDAAVTPGGIRIDACDPVAVDGASGLIVHGACRRVCDLAADVAALLDWTSAHRIGSVVAAVAHPHDAALADALGADALAVLVPEAAVLAAGVRDVAALGPALAELFRRASRGPVYVRLETGHPPLAVAALAAADVERAVAEAAEQAGVSTIVLGVAGSPSLWRPGEADPGGPVVAWADAASLEVAADRVVRSAGCALACAPEQVPAARLALARAALRRQ
jgi:phosphohistidine swiveling domain-containing protein